MCEPAVVSYGERLAAALLAEPGIELIGVYLHGSVVLGGFNPQGSDVDLLAVIAEPADATIQARVRDALVAAANPCPGTGLELSVITAATAAALADCPFEVHVNVEGDQVGSALGADSGGDPDLVLYAEVCQRHARAVHGPPASEVFGPVPPARLLPAVHQELQWGLGNSHLSYAVLNACRALRFATDGVLCSKVAAGEWALASEPERMDEPVVAAALAQQRAGEKLPVSEAAAQFVAKIGNRLSGMIESGAR